MRVNQVSYLQNNQQVQSFTSGMPVGNLEKGLERIRVKNEAEDAPGRLRSIIGYTGYGGGLLIALYEIITLPLDPNNINKLWWTAGGITTALISHLMLGRTGDKIINFFKSK